MRTRRYWVATALFLLLMAGAVAAIVLSGRGDTAQAARATVEAFCLNEFEGNDPFVREQLARFSPEVEKTAFQRGDETWRMMYVDLLPLVVVGSYEIKDVRVEGHRATAVVAYRRLARTEHLYGNSYVPDKKDNDLVTLNLVFDKGRRPPAQNVSFITATWNSVFSKAQWWILDPPVQRVSKRVLLEYYEGKVREYSSTWERELNDPSYSAKQKANMRASHDQATGNLRFLKNLP